MDWGFKNNSVPSAFPLRDTLGTGKSIHSYPFKTRGQVLPEIELVDLLEKKKNKAIKRLGWVSLLNGISTFVCYLMPLPSF